MRWCMWHFLGEARVASPKHPRRKLFYKEFHKSVTVRFFGYPASRGGHALHSASKKTIKGSLRNMEISVPRDRQGEFGPQLVKKNQTTLTGDIEEKILFMYAQGMTTADIECHIKEIYGLEVSDSTVSRITEKILPVVREWQARPLENIYAVVFMDAIHFHVRSEGQIIKKRYISPFGPTWMATKTCGHVGWRERKRQVLAVRPQWSEKPSILLPKVKTE